MGNYHSVTRTISVVAVANRSSVLVTIFWIYDR